MFKAFEWLCWIGVTFMTLLASLRMLMLWMQPSASAPQYAAEAAGIMAMAVVPYVFARAIQEWRAHAQKRPPPVRAWSDTEPG